MDQDYKKRMIMEYTTDNGTVLHKLTASYGWTCIKEQAPYFSITYVERENGREVGCGTNHKVIAEHFPGLAFLTKWHLVSRDPSQGPLHYLANAKYWAEVSKGIQENTNYGPDPLVALKSTIVFGALHSDTCREDMIADEVLGSSWLTYRLPDLMDAFRRDMERAELWNIGEETHRSES